MSTPQSSRWGSVPTSAPNQNEFKTDSSVGALQPPPCPADPKMSAAIVGHARKAGLVNHHKAAATPEPIDRQKLLGKVAIAENHQADSGEAITQEALRIAPSWLVSLIVHMILLIFLGLLTLPKIFSETIELEFAYSQEEGEQVLEVILESETLEEIEETEPVLSENFTFVEDPLATLAELDPVVEALTATDSLESLAIGLALTGRTDGMKKTLLAAYGGNAMTEAAVRRGLLWLQKNQLKDGSWSLHGPYSDGGRTPNKTAATAMALLAFQGAGYTHQKGEFKTVVARGWRTLLRSLDNKGNFYQSGPEHQQLYSQALATIALCELYGMTQDGQLKQQAQSAIDYAIKYQTSEGGWRYTPGSDSDTSVTGWFVMALQSALMAGLEVPSPSLMKISNYLDRVSKDGGSQYSYQPGQGAKPAMTAEGLLCRQYLGWKRDDPRLVRGIEFINKNPINFKREKNTYYWYYATQVTHHMGGEAWEQWNDVMREELPKYQVKSGSERGSWNPSGDRWARVGGRLYQTCLCIYMLEVYYRHLPIYSYKIQQ